MQTSLLNRVARVFLAALLFVPSLALAQQTYFVSGEGPTFIQDPNRPAQYNRTLAGTANRYQFVASTPTTITIALAMPDVPESKRDVSAALVLQGSETEPIAVLDPALGDWDTKYTDTKTGMRYLVGPSLTSALPAGAYEVIVWSSNNDSEYAILFGDRMASPAAATSTPPTRNGVNPWLVIGCIAVILLAVRVVRERQERIHRQHHQ